MGNWLFGRGGVKDHEKSTTSSSSDGNSAEPDTFSVTILNKSNIVQNPTGHNVVNNDKYRFCELSRHQRVFGRYGTVQDCLVWELGLCFACKVISKDNLRSQVEIDYVKNEVAVLRHLQGHPNVVSLKDVYEDEDEVHIVMERCWGGTLWDRTYYYVGNEKRVARLMTTIVQAVQMMHKKGVIHRDLKPQNLIFEHWIPEQPSRLKVIDFGLSHFFKPGEKYHDRNGTPLYMAPELWRGNYGPEVDIWSVGVIFYRLLSGAFPFPQLSRGNMDEMAAEAIKRTKVDFESYYWSRAPKNVKDLIAKMLKRNPKKRITADLILKDPWLQMMNTKGNEDEEY